MIKLQASEILKFFRASLFILRFKCMLQKILIKDVYFNYLILFIHFNFKSSFYAPAYIMFFCNSRSYLEAKLKLKKNHQALGNLPKKIPLVLTVYV